MFPLQSKNVPSSKEELARALEESLRRFVRKDAPLVAVSSRVFPYFDEIAINLDGAQFDSDLPAPPRVIGETKQICEAAIVTASARDVVIQGVPLDLRMEVRDVVFHTGQDENGQAFLIVQKAREGHVVVSVDQSDLEKVITETARVQAAKHAVSVENVRLALRARGARSLAVNVRFQARKFILRTNVDISGQLDVTDDFVAKASHLQCKGDGAIGSLACGVLEPHLRRLDGENFPLMSLPLGEIKLRDIRIAVADTVEVTADFGTDQA
jgi:hypothetical protein